MATEVRAKNDNDVTIVTACEASSLEVLQNAFFEDTKNINSLSACKAVPVSYLRELVKKHNPTA